MKNDRPGTPDEVRADLTVTAKWTSGWAFDAGRPDGPKIRIDGNSKEGPSPPETLLASLATCTAVDVVEMLTKRRTPPATLEVTTTGERKAEVPRRVTRAHLAYKITGAGIDRTQTMRAIELAVTRYCTVRDTMDPEMAVTWSLELG
ncbi:MAG: OsmC family protein [Gemmatimonadaceae bacterium]